MMQSVLWEVEPLQMWVQFLRDSDWDTVNTWWYYCRIWKSYVRWAPPHHPTVHHAMLGYNPHKCPTFHGTMQHLESSLCHTHSDIYLYYYIHVHLFHSSCIHIVCSYVFCSASRLSTAACYTSRYYVFEYLMVTKIIFTILITIKRLMPTWR